MYYIILTTLSVHLTQGDTKYKVPRLDPLDIKELKIQQGSTQLGLAMILKDAKVFGLHDAQFIGAR